MSEMSAANIKFSPRTDKEAVEAGPGFAPKFDGAGLITAVAVDADDGSVLMLAYMNEESLRLTLTCGEAVITAAAGRKSGTRARPAATSRKWWKSSPIATRTPSSCGCGRRGREPATPATEVAFSAAWR